jgi:hypothetical protein
VDLLVNGGEFLGFRLNSDQKKPNRPLAFVMCVLKNSIAGLIVGGQLWCWPVSLG